VLSQARRANLRHECGEQRILNLLNLEDTPLAPCAFAMRDREAHVRAAFAPETTTFTPDRQRLQSKACILTRLITLIATLILAGAVLFRSPSDFRMSVCIMVSVAATAVVVRSFFTGKFVWALLFVGVLGVFTPLHRTQYSHLIISILDMVTLALLAASPIILGKSTGPLVLKPAKESIAITRQ